MSDETKIHHSSLCLSQDLGTGISVGAFCFIGNAVRFGKGCTIENNVSIDGNIIIGNNVSIGSGTRLIGDIVIGDNVDIDENVVLRGKMSESSENHPEAKEILSIDDNVSIGANSTISGVFNVGFAARVYPASAVSKEIPKFASTSGNPAEIIGYRSSGYDPVLEESSQIDSENACKICRIPRVTDMRGSLVYGEFEKNVPFEAKRFFVIFDVHNSKIRGEHAHRECHQFLVCVQGSLKVFTYDGSSQEEFKLDSPDLGLYIPPMVWASQHEYTEETKLLVFASQFYDPDDYIRDYSEFLKLCS